MSAKYTNNYTILKDILKNEYTFILTLLFNNFDDIIHLLKEKRPFYGEVLEYLYLSMPTYYNSTHDNICQQYRYIDDVLRILYKNHKKYICAEFKNDIKNICNDFHIEESEFSYYYYIALAIIILESPINEDAFNLYSQLNDEIANNITYFLHDFLNILTKKEFQCLFYNHLEDVYHTNRSINEELSLIYSDNYSYFLDNFNLKSMFFTMDSIPYQYSPIIITNKGIYNVTNDNKINYICNPSSIEDMNLNILNSNINYVAQYNLINNTISNWIPFFNYFYNKYNNLSNELCIPLFDDYIINAKELNQYNNLLLNSNSFSIFNERISDIHYWINQFTIYNLDFKEEN